jgi:hypothetical protein
MRRTLPARVVVVVVQRRIHNAGLGSGMLLLLQQQTMVHRWEIVGLGRIGGVELVVLLLGLLRASQSVGGGVGRRG